MADQYMPDDERDAVLDKLISLPENKVLLLIPCLPVFGF